MKDYTDESCSTASVERDEEPHMMADMTMSQKEIICSEPSYENLFVNQSNIKPDYGIVICGHRGGQGKSEPENTMRAFKKAKELGLQMIEFDVSTSDPICLNDPFYVVQIWLTADDQLVIIHGGDDGEMPAPLFEQENSNSETLQKQHYIFEQTFSDLQA